MPILLHREAGLWRIDLVETWKNLFFDESGNYYLKNSNTPYAFGLTQFGEGQFHDIAALPLTDRTLVAEFAALSARQGVLPALRRGELWFRNCFVFAPAFTAYAEAQAAAPRDPLVLLTLADRALYLGLPELAIPALERVGRGVELDLVQAYAAAGNTAKARLWLSRALAENPYDLQALRWQQHLGRQPETASADAGAELLAELSQDREWKAGPVVLRFSPGRPQYHAENTLDIGGTTVYDHSRFSVTMTNTSLRPVDIERVDLVSEGDGAASGLGNIVDYWRFPSGARRLAPRESVTFDKTWGFVKDTSHTHVRYVFRTCWHGAGTTLRQCRTQWVDTLP